MFLYVLDKRDSSYVTSRISFCLRKVNLFLSFFLFCLHADPTKKSGSRLVGDVDYAEASKVCKIRFHYIM